MMRITMKSRFAIYAFLLGTVSQGCGSDSSKTNDVPVVSPDAKKANAPEKVKGKQVTKSNMPTMKYVD